MTQSKAIAWTICGGLVLAGLAVLFWFDPVQNAFYPTCMFHRLTGLNCPGCGSLRALHHLAHGRVLSAFHCNPLLVTALPLVLGVAAHWALRSGPAPRFFLRPGAWWWLVAVIAVFGIVRNLPFPAFAWMSP